MSDRKPSTQRTAGDQQHANDTNYADTRTFLNRLEQADVTLSKIIFQMSLPLPLEFLFSIPGNLMGPPFLQIVGPLWMILMYETAAAAAAAANNSSADNNDTIAPLPLPMMWVVTLGATIGLLLVPWIFFLRGHSWIFTRIFYSHASFVLSPLLGMAITQCYYMHYSGAWLLSDNSTNNNNTDGAENQQSSRKTVAALCFHSLLLYNACCIPVLFLKHGFRRTRPCGNAAICDAYMARKHFPIIPRTLARTGAKTSFPSGDVMAATCFALSLAHLPSAIDSIDDNQNQQQEENRYLALLALSIAIVVLAAFGRMYFLAHHLVDTIVGMLIPVGLHTLCLLLENNDVLPTVGAAEWYHSLAAFLGLVAASRFRRNNQK